MLQIIVAGLTASLLLLAVYLMRKDRSPEQALKESAGTLEK
jgi:uncharacterized protein YoxC